MTIDTDIVKRSVTQGDTWPGSGTIRLNIWAAIQPNQILKLLPDLPLGYSQEADLILSSTRKVETYWAGAISIAITKMSSLGWDMTGDVPLRVKRAQEMFHSANAGKGWVNFLKKHLLAYLCTDNGAFIEVVRASGAAGSKILGLVHLDPHRCLRTGDPETPVLYKDLHGAWHELKAHQVLSLSDMPDESESLFDVGECAARRAYPAIQLMAAIQRYMYEKISGARPLSIEFLSGVSPQQLEDATISAENNRKEKGGVAFGGSIMIPFVRDTNVGKVSVPISSLPDNFDRKEELSNGLLAYANSIGLDPQDVQPLTGHAIGTGSQSQVLDNKAKGKGLISWMTEFAAIMNEHVLPDTVTFTFSEPKDYRDLQAKATVTNTLATAVTTLQEKGTVGRDEARQMLVDADQMPREFIKRDVTATETLSNDEKPSLIEQEQTGMATVPQIQESMTSRLMDQIDAILGKKEAGDAKKLVGQEAEKARKIYEGLING